MLPLLDRDFAKSFAQSFATALALTFVLTLVNVLLDNYRYIFGGGDSKIRWVLLYFVLTLPQQASYMLPLATSASILWVLLQKTRENEILAYLACGVAPARLARPFLVSAAAISFVGLFLSEGVAGKANQKAHQVEKVYIMNRRESVVTQRNQIVVRLRGERYCYVGIYDEKFRQMERVTVLDLQPDGSTLKQKIEIRQGNLVGDVENPSWMLKDVSVRKYDESGMQSSYEEFAQLQGAVLDPPLEGSLSRFLSATQSPQRMTYAELREYLQLQEEQGKADNPQWETELQLKITVPFVTLILALLMCAHAVRPSSSGVMKNFGGGLVWMAGVFVVQMVTRKMGDMGVLPAMLAAWAPIGIFAAVGTWLLTRPRFA